MTNRGKKEGKAKIQKFEYLQNKKRFLDEIRRIFQNYLSVILWWKYKKYQTQALKETEL